jgi:hypothetical protein
MQNNVIGDMAGKVWKVLGAKDKIALTTLPKVLEEDGALVNQAVGWLAREGKIAFEKQGRAVYVKLTEHEAAAFKHHAGNGHKA